MFSNLQLCVSVSACSLHSISILVISPSKKRIKAGFSGDEAPRSVFPSNVARSKHEQSMLGMV